MFGLISDTHNHNWSAFSTVDEEGVNTRLKTILNETVRAAEEVKDAGGNTLVHGGDLFHVRGNIAPSVLNPTLDVYRYIIEGMGMKIVMLPGNHDMEGRDSLRNTNAVQALESVGVTIANDPTIDDENKLVLIPWHSSVESLQETIVKMQADLLTKDDTSRYSLILHAPLDDVIPGIPAHGLTADWLRAETDFNRIFCGHYHNYKDFGNGVYSIGALTHQTWGDVGSKAGHLLVGDRGVNYRASRAPEFIDLDATMNPDDVPLVVDGNYVRARVEIERESQVQELREWLLESGAKGVVIHPIKSTSTVSRTGSTVKSGATMEASIADFIKSKSYRRKKELGELCMDILSEAEAVA